jgi:hypothetical protein
LAVEVKSEITNAEGYGPLDHVMCSVEVEDTSLPLAADVVANSLYDHFKKKFEGGQIKRLLDPDAVEGHELADSI